MTTYYATHSDFALHQLSHAQHPERPERIQSVWRILDSQGLTPRLHAIEPVLALEEALARVHTAHHLARLANIAKQDSVVMYDSDTYALPASYSIAKKAAGSVIQLIDAVMATDNSNGIAVVRPPGHHATAERSMGFCLLNNIAIGAQYALDHGLAKRIAIVDYDVHHGNGTQDIFYERDDVLFISSHQSPFYPGTGLLHEVGKGAGEGYTLNIPLPVGVGDSGYTKIFDSIILPRLADYAPDLILVSAGFDAHWIDPLAMMQLSLSGYALITDKLLKSAHELCDGKIIFVMEGGYDLQAIGYGIANIATRLLDEFGELSDPYGLATADETDIRQLIENIRTLHQIS